MDSKSKIDKQTSNTEMKSVLDVMLHHLLQSPALFCRTLAAQIPYANRPFSKCIHKNMHINEP